MKRIIATHALLLTVVLFCVFSYADYTGQTFNQYTTHYYYQIEPNGQWYWNDTVTDRIPDGFHGDIDSYIDYIGYTYMGEMVRLCDQPIYVGSDHSH